MNLSTLSKEQKQYVVLGILATAVLGILIVLGVKVSLSSIAEARDELEVVTGKIDSASRMLTRRDRTTSDFRQTMRMLSEYLESAPPDRNYYSWATEVVYSEARKVGLEIDTVNEIANVQQDAGKDAGTVKLESYALRIRGSGSYEGIKQFIAVMEEDYRLVRFVGMDISVGEDPDSHAVQLWIQWPFNLGSVVADWDAIEAMQNELDEPVASDAVSTPEPVAEVVPEIVPDSAKVAPRPEAMPEPDVKEEVIVEPAPVPVEEVEPEPEQVQSDPEVAVAIAPVAEQPEIRKTPTPPPPRIQVAPVNDTAEAVVPVIKAQPAVPVEPEFIVPAVDPSAESIDVIPVETFEPEEDAADGPDPRMAPHYVITEKSASILEEALMNKEEVADNKALNSLINSLMENRDETE
ncbi:MAG: hypothetical protein JXR25_10520 [Pontiellaceae bacterium]|nr:hypothetical protein [Pontiellaceae bacterium]MBN2785253.1 hypothetical protein [Pontiellaceae bacterium]